MVVDELGCNWIHALGGVAMATAAAARRQGERGSVIDCALVAANLFTKVRRPVVGEAALTSPRRPVLYQLQVVDVPMWCR
eukprot:683659-Pyramimonas_sp.AAC.1